MFILPKAIYIFSAIPIKIQTVFFTDVEKNNHHIIHIVSQTPQVAKDGYITISGFKIKYKVAIAQMI
jgi:hypothetical protein